MTVSAEVENPTLAQLPYIRDAYIILYARSDSKFSLSNNYVRNNLETIVSIRGMDFYNRVHLDPDELIERRLPRFHC